MSDCDDALANVYSYLDREANRYRSWRIRRHLHECDGCERAYVFEERLRIVIRERLHEEVPDEFLTRLRQALHGDS
jgi:mycothiol system anti-sigma-R factor